MKQIHLRLIQRKKIRKRAKTIVDFIRKNKFVEKDVWRQALIEIKALNLQKDRYQNKKIHNARKATINC